MALIDMINKYSSDNNPIRLSVILESYKKKATKSNIEALKLLISDGDIEAIKLFLGDSDSLKKEFEEDINRKLAEESKKPPNQDDFTITVIKNLGDPKDPNSLGNKILTGQTYHWMMKTNIKPDVLLNKFAQLAGKDSVEIAYHPNFSSNPPIWECGIAGAVTIKTDRWTRVN
jgi:hypothetical protein